MESRGPGIFDRGPTGHPRHVPFKKPLFVEPSGWLIYSGSMLAVSFVLCPGFWRMTCHHLGEKHTQLSQPQNRLLVMVILIRNHRRTRWLERLQVAVQGTAARTGSSAQPTFRSWNETLMMLRPRTCVSSFKCWKSASKKKVLIKSDSVFLPWITFPKTQFRPWK